MYCMWEIMEWKKFDTESNLSISPPFLFSPVFYPLQNFPRVMQLQRDIAVKPLIQHLANPEYLYNLIILLLSQPFISCIKLP